MSDPKLDPIVIALTKQLTDDGKLIEAGWVSLRAIAIPPDATPLQLDEMRNAFFAGAQHLFGSLMNILEEGEDATDADIGRLEQISNELDIFIADFSKRHGL